MSSLLDQYKAINRHAQQAYGFALACQSTLHKLKEDFDIDIMDDLDDVVELAKQEGVL